MSRIFDEQAKANRKQAEDEVRRLLGLVRIPLGAVALDSAPEPLSGAVHGPPNVSTYAGLARSWRVPVSFAALDDYVRRHPPAGLSAESNSSVTKDTVILSRGYGWRDHYQRDSFPLPGALLTIQLTPAEGSADVSYLRADAATEWLDPHPIRDTMSGTRLRLETGQSCPDSERGFGDVRNDGADDLDGALVPEGAPTSVLVCVYPGVENQTSALPQQRTLPPTEAARVAAAAHSVDLAHRYGAVIHRPGRSWRGPTIVVVLSYPSRPAVNLYISTGDCLIASNGHVVAPATPSVDVLVDLVNQAAG